MKLMVGVFVTYSNNLIASCRSLLKDLFDRALEPFYDDDIQLPQENIQKIISKGNEEEKRAPVTNLASSIYT